MFQTVLPSDVSKYFFAPPTEEEKDAHVNAAVYKALCRKALQVSEYPIELTVYDIRQAGDGLRAIDSVSVCKRIERMFSEHWNVKFLSSRGEDVTVESHFTSKSPLSDTAMQIIFRPKTAVSN